MTTGTKPINLCLHACFWPTIALRDITIIARPIWSRGAKDTVIHRPIGFFDPIAKVKKWAGLQTTKGYKVPRVKEHCCASQLDLQPEPCRRWQSSAVKFPAGHPMAVGNFRVKPAPFNSKYHHRSNFLTWLQPSKYRVFEIKTKKFRNNELERN